MTWKPVNINDQWLEDMNDGTAAMGPDMISFDRSYINALICEVQAWRRQYPSLVFRCGPNVLSMKPVKIDAQWRGDSN